VKTREHTPSGRPVLRQHRPYLGVHFLKCHVYGRLYRNRESTAYQGVCPRCGAAYRIPIGEGGTSERFFKAVCP
jgi:hypothetical protein